MFVVMPGRSCCVCVHRVAAYRTSSQPPTVQHSQGAQLHRAWHTSLTELKLQTNNIEAISGPNQFSPARFIQFRYFEKYYVVSHSALHCKEPNKYDIQKNFLNFYYQPFPIF